MRTRKFAFDIYWPLEPATSVWLTFLCTEKNTLEDLKYIFSIFLSTVSVPLQLAACIFQNHFLKTINLRGFLFKILAWCKYSILERFYSRAGYDGAHTIYYHIQALHSLTLYWLMWTDIVRAGNLEGSFAKVASKIKYPLSPR